MAPTPQNRQIFFARRPNGDPSSDAFDSRLANIATPSQGEILCRNLVLSVDPYLRLKMHDRRSYTPPLQIGEIIPGRSVAKVIESCSDAFRPGDHVVISGGWQDYAVVAASAAKKVDLSEAPIEAWLGPLGMTGQTAYAGLLDIGKPKAGDTLVVSGAAGAVGSLVGQIGKILGCRVIGIAGSGEKCRTVVNAFGFDACVNYREADFDAQLAGALSGGCDIYFDNVGGRISLAVSTHYSDFARVAVCGLISQYSQQQPLAPTSFDEFMRLVLTRRLTVRGFIISDLASGYDGFEKEMSAWLASGRIVPQNHAHHGFDKIVPAFLGMLSGDNTGKTLVHI